MKKRAVRSLVFAILLFCGVTTAQDSSLPSVEWTVQLWDGKGQNQTLEYTPMENLIEDYYENLYSICRWNVAVPSKLPPTEDDRRPFQSSNLVVTKIGKWGHYEVLDITIPDIKHKSIILEDPNKHYWVLYAQFVHSTADVEDLPTINKLDDEEVLSYRTLTPGTGHYTIEEHFMIDSSTLRPKSLDLTPIPVAIDSVMPQGFTRTYRQDRQTFSFDIGKGIYKDVIAKESELGEPNPICGSAVVEFGFGGGELAVKQVRLEFNYQELSQIRAFSLSRP